MDGDGARQAAQLEREIEETRQQLDHTFDQLEERLTVDHLMTEVRGRLSETARSLLDTIERHPSAVIGAVALGAILLRRRHNARARAASDLELAAADLLHLLEARAAAAASQAGNAGSQTFQSAGRTLGDYASELGGQASELLHQAGEGLGEAAQQAREHGEALLEQLRETDLRPMLPYGLLALAIAAGIGLARARRD